MGQSSDVDGFLDMRVAVSSDTRAEYLCPSMSEVETYTSYRNSQLKFYVLLRLCCERRLIDESTSTDVMFDMPVKANGFTLLIDRTKLVFFTLILRIECYDSQLSINANELASSAGSVKSMNFKASLIVFRFHLVSSRNYQYVSSDLISSLSRTVKVVPLLVEVIIVVRLR